MTIQCLVCGEVLTSRFHHDFQQCSCENQAHVDGGNDYMKIGAMDISKVKIIGEPSTNDRDTECVDLS